MGQRAGLDLHPVTNGRGAVDAFGRFLELAPMPSRGHVVGMDLEVVGIDLETIPLDDVLEYRRENADAHRRYMQNLRSFALDLSLMEEEDRRRALADRRADLADEARDLRSRASAAWKSPKDVARLRARPDWRGVVSRDREPGPRGTRRSGRRAPDAPVSGHWKRVLVPLPGSPRAVLALRSVRRWAQAPALCCR